MPNANAVNNFFVNVNVGPNTEKSVPKVPNILPENSSLDVLVFIYGREWTFKINA